MALTAMRRFFTERWAMANNIAVSITADVADLSVKRAIMSAELKAATKDLNTFAKEAAGGANTAELREGMLASAVAAEQARAKISMVNTELKEMAAVATPAVHETERGFAALSATISESGVKLRETLGVMGEMREAAMAFGELLLAAFAVEAIEHFADKLGEAAEHTKHVSEQMGLTVKQTQGLQAAATAVGVPFDKLVTGLGLIDKKFESDPKLFKQLGILLPQNATQMQILEATMDRFQGLQNGPQKTALALTIMGRAGKEMIPFLNEGSKGLEELLGKAEKYGAISQDASDKGVALAEAINEGKVASMGLSNTLTSALGPILTSMVSGFSDMVAAITASYNAGGTVKVVFDAISEVMSGIGEILLTVGDAFKTLFGTTGVSAQDWGSVIKFVIDEVVIVIKILITSVELIGLAFKVIFESMAADAVRWYGDTREMFQRAGLALTILGDDFKTLGKVAIDALTLSWGSIAADWDAGMRQVDNVVKSRGAQIIADAQNIKNTAKALLEAAAGDKAKGDALLKTDLTKRHGGPSETGVKEGEGARGGEVDLQHHGKPKNAKAEKDTTVQDAEAALETLKTKFAEMQAAQGTYENYSLADEAKFWEAQKDRTDVSAKAKLELEKKWLAARAALHREDQSNTLDTIKANEALQVAAVKNEVELAKYALQEKLQIVDQEEQAGAITAAEAARQRVVLNQRLIELDMDLATREYQIKRGAIVAELLFGQMTADQRKRRNEQLIALDTAYADQSMMINRKADLQKQKDNAAVVAAQRSVFQQTYQGFADNIGKMVTLQQGFMATLRGSWQSLQGIISQAVSRMVMTWIAGLGAKEAAEAASHSKTMLKQAKEAAAGAWNAVVHIPIIGPFLAPPAAAVAFAGVMAYAEQGYDVPAGVNPITQLHQREMVLPAPIADTIRGMAGRGGGSNDNGGGGIGGGSNVTVNLSAIDTRTGHQFLMDNKHSVAKAVGEAVRNGHRMAGAR